MSKPGIPPIDLALIQKASKDARRPAYRQLLRQPEARRLNRASPCTKTT